MSDDILTIREVAEYLKVTEKTVYGLVQRRQIPGFKVGGQWRFRREDLDSWIASQTADTVQGNETDNGQPGGASLSKPRRRRGKSDEHR